MGARPERCVHRRRLQSEASNPTKTAMTKRTWPRHMKRGSTAAWGRRPGLTGKQPLTYSPVMAVSHIQLVSLPVRDQDRARDFYVNVLGFDLVRDNPMGSDSRWVQVAPKGAQTAVTLVTWFPTMPAGSTKGTVLETTDLDRDVADLTAKGVTIDGGIQEQPWGRFVTFDDPDGNGIVLQETASDA